MPSRGIFLTEGSSPCLFISCIPALTDGFFVCLFVFLTTSVTWEAQLGIRVGKNSRSFFFFFSWTPRLQITPLVASFKDSDGKASVYNAGNSGSIPGSGRSPGEGNGNPLQYYCLENPMDRGAWQATAHGVAKSRTGLSDFTFTFKQSLKFVGKFLSHSKIYK